MPADVRALAYRDATIPLGRGRYANLPMATGRLLTEAYLTATDRVLLIGAIVVGEAHPWFSAEHSVVLWQVMDLLRGAVGGGELTGRAPAWLLRHAHVCVYAALVS